MRVMRSRASASCSSRHLLRIVSRGLRCELITIDVPMCPGITTDTFTCGAFRRKSLISASVKPFTANFAAL